MKWKTLRRFYISQLRLPGDFLQRVRSSDHVGRIAESIKATGFTRPPVVRMYKHHRMVVCGLDTIAAMALLGHHEVICAGLECTEQEAYQASLADNLVRREWDEKSAEERARSLLESAPVTRKAAREIAEELGIERLVSVSLRRTWRAGQAPESKAQVDLVDLGMELAQEWLDKVNAVYAELAGMLAQVHGLLGCIHRLRSLPIGGPLLDSWARELQILAGTIRDAAPYAVCPYCKAMPVKGCGPCSENRWVNKVVFDSAPAKLKDVRDKVMVSADGNAVRLKDFRP